MIPKSHSCTFSTSKCVCFFPFRCLKQHRHWESTADAAPAAPTDESTVADGDPADTIPASVSDGSTLVDAAAAAHVAPASPSKGSVAAAPDSSNDASRVSDMALTGPNEGSTAADAASVSNGSTLVDCIASADATPWLADVDRFVSTHHFTESAAQPILVTSKFKWI